MHILTIYRLDPELQVEYQQASPDIAVLRRAAVLYAERLGYELEDETVLPEELYAEVEDWFDAMVEPDDPRLLLRKADA